MNSNLYQKFFDSFNLYRENVFIKFPKDQRLSPIRYKDVIEKVDIFSSFLKKMGLKKGQRIFIQTDKSVEAIWIYLASLKLGAIYVPLNIAYTPSELEYFIADAKPTIFVTDNYDKIKNVLNTFEKLTVINLQNLNSSMEKYKVKEKSEIAFCLDEDIAAILYTSGTTGKPKGASISNKNLFSNCSTLVELWKMTSKDTLLHILPIYHTHGLFVAINTIMIAGGSMIFFPKFNEESLMPHFKEGSIMMGVPTHYIRLLTILKNNDNLQNFRLFISGSAPLSSRIHNEFYKKTGFKILERYGMTETNMLTSNPYKGFRKAGTVGFPLPNVDIRIRDLKTNKIVGQESKGSIEVKGPNVFNSYWNKDKETKKEFTNDNFFKTGDVGFFDKEGYLNISGRNKDLIITGGLNVYPAEIEKVIDEIPEIEESSVIGLPHNDFGEGVTAVVSLKTNMDINVENIKVILKKKLAGFKIPQKFIVLDELPKNAMGKVKKNDLRKLYQNIYKF